MAGTASSSRGRLADGRGRGFVRRATSFPLRPVRVPMALPHRLQDPAAATGRTSPDTSAAARPPRCRRSPGQTARLAAPGGPPAPPPAGPPRPRRSPAAPPGPPRRPPASARRPRLLQPLDEPPVLGRVQLLRDVGESSAPRRAHRGAGQVDLQHPRGPRRRRCGWRPSSRIARNRSGGCQHPPASRTSRSSAQRSSSQAQPSAVDSRRLSSRAGSSGSSLSPDQETRPALAEVVPPVGIQAGRAAGVPEQPAAQRRDLVGPLREAVGDGGAGVRRPGVEGAVGAVELPGEPDRPLHEEALDVVAGAEVGRPAVHAGVQGVGVLAGEDSLAARIPCLRALNRERSLPSGVLGPVDFRALRRFASVRRLDVAVSLMVGGPLRGRWSAEPVSSADGAVG